MDIVLEKLSTFKIDSNLKMAEASSSKMFVFTYKYGSDGGGRWLSKTPVST
jgi:hypothetical protein